ncbi:MAG: FtsX-like permease family protein, partial [bacterium]|nr:FtsX-like permease family protein [bacterium]
TSMETFFQLEGWGNEWDGSYCKTYILLSENADPEELETKFPAFMDNYRYRDSDVEDSMKEKLYLQPLTSIHLNSHINAEFKANYDMKNVYLFSSVGLLIIIIACMNYMNLATTRAIKRSKEVGMRKVAGAKRGQLIKQFIGESVVLTMIALFVSMILVYMILPWFSTYLGKDLNLNPLENISLIFLPVVLLIVVGIIAGSYPALYISSFRPVAILKGNITKSSRKAGLRNILVAGQFTITILMIISTLVVKDQLNFIRKKDMGFSREQILVINTAGNSSFVRNAQTLISELQRNPNIGEVSAPVYLPNNMLVQNDQILPAKEEGKFVTVIGNWVDYSFTDLFELEIVEGRNFSREFSSDAQGAVLINETAAEACKWDSPLGKVFNTKNWGRNDVTIVGIVKDFHLRSLHEPIRPAMILLSPNSFASLAMKINTENIPETINYVKNTLDRYSPGYPFEYHFFDEIFEESYKAEKKTEAIFNVFAYLSIIIACIGLIGLSSFTAEQKTREIGIRKTFGATVPGIVSLLSKEFTKWVLISNIIAWPLANFFMSRWLEQFAYRIDMSIITYFTAGGAALLIAFITVSFQSVKAAMTNPTVSLRHQ